MKPGSATENCAGRGGHGIAERALAAPHWRATGLKRDLQPREQNFAPTKNEQEKSKKDLAAAKGSEGTMRSGKGSVNQGKEE